MPDLARRALLLAAAAPSAFSQQTARVDADRSGRADSVRAFQRVLAAGGRIQVPSGRYRFEVRGDADTLVVPSDCELVCDPGVTFEWDNWGSPLFAIINRRNVRLLFNGAKIVWGGTYARTRGARDAFGYGAPIPAYEWCSNVISMGSDNVTVEGLRCEGRTQANVQNALLQFGGRADGSQASGNVARGITGDDVCQVLLFGAQRDFLFEDITGGRYSNASASLYGPGHVIYATAQESPSEGGVINRVVDRGTPLTAYTEASHSVQLKRVNNTKVTGIQSARAEGALVVLDCENLTVIGLRYRCSSMQRDTNHGTIFFPEPKGVNHRVKISGTIEHLIARTTASLNMGGMRSSAKNLGCQVDLALDVEGSANHFAVFWVGDDGSARLRYRSKTPGKPPQLLRVFKGSHGNQFDLTVEGDAQPRVAADDDSADNVFHCGAVTTVTYDPKRLGRNQMQCR